MQLRLDLDTRGKHAAADECWVALMSPDVTRLEYRRQLARVYGFEAPVEAAFAYTAGLRAVFDVRQRSRAGLLAQDLMALGLTPKQVADLPQLFVPAFASIVEALGWMYVVERATLLHDSVRQALARHLPGSETASAYLSAYHGVTNARWNALGQVLDAVVGDNDAVLALTIASAHAGFDALVEWNADAEVSQYARGA